ncbi:MAG: hypothetical protein ING65_16635 [Rhodocyclaceae bacterium]|jgi:hypothetical protein|nr:hypothetical protein [Rhodocyclaceae bacterium]
MSLFTETPIEAALWTFAVSLQDKLSASLFQTPLFRGAVALFMGFVVARALMRFGSGTPNPWLPMVGGLVCSLTGLALLGAGAGEAFRPTTSDGRTWASAASGRAGSGVRYEGLQQGAKGLRYYRLAHEAANGLSRVVSDEISQVFGDSGGGGAPQLLFKTLQETARHTLDDPEVIATANRLMESCQREKAYVAGAAFASLSSNFDLQRENCAALHQQFKSQLDGWARARISSPGSKLVVLAEAARNNALTRSIGLDDSESLKNKVIASAVEDYLQTRAGLTSNNTNPEALLDGRGGGSGSHSRSFLGTSTWVRLSRALSLGGAMNLVVRPFTGTDYEAADTRNDVAALYTKVSVFLPALRGFAKALLALMFLVAAARLCFGSPSLLISWGWCLLLFTAYEPLSTLLYQATVTLTQAPETVQAMEALRADPLVLVGAQVMDSYASRVQGTYFVLQLGLTALTAVGALGVFRYQRALGGQLASVILSKGVSAVRTAALVKASPATAAKAGAAGAATRSGATTRRDLT